MQQWKNLFSSDAPHKPRAYTNSAVQFHHTFSPHERLTAAEKAHWNVFQFPAEMLFVDLLSDSGTTTLTSEQWAKMFLGDEAYGTNRGYKELMGSFQETFGISEDTHDIYLFHQGRAAEHALFSQLGKMAPSQSIIPSNGHFDTTRANIEANNIAAIDLLDDASDPDFRGNMDITTLEKELRERGDKIPLIYTTITNNTGGGQPVSLKNLKQIRELCNQFKKPLFLDICRFAENAWFIHEREKEYRDATITKIVFEIISLCDGFTVSLKKDGLSNMGGALVIKKESAFTKKYSGILNAIRDHQILTEGHPSYGGLTGRDILVIAEGLKMVITKEYLSSRVSLVRSFGEYMDSLGIPVLKPFGGHAVYIDIDRFFEGTDMKRENFGGIALTGLLLIKGVRLCELGAFAFGKWNSKTNQEEFRGHNFIRCAVPRNKYEIQDLYYVADCVKNLHDGRDEIPRAVPIYGRELTLRHFKARFELR